MVTVNYKRIAQRVDGALKQVGMPVKVSRAGVPVGTGYGVFKSAREGMEATTQLQTIVSESNFILSGMAKPPQVGDVLTANKADYTIKAVETVRPTSTTLAYKLELA